MGHLRRHHSCDPYFSVTCGIDGCPKTFTKFSTFRSHVSFHHGDCFSLGENQPAAMMHDDDGIGESICPGESNPGGSGEGEETSIDAGGEDANTSIDTMKQASALFILGTKEKFKLTQVATEGIIEGASNLMQV